ncbi:MAG: LytTR family transcriptional regulator DNA-binding domain-containing protein [Marinilabiliaceae bacterium]|nr:LytTR family transcriptional regulator DNA-binding domain-containing protein [Marinilabiliaceae bacterium]
MDFDANTPRYLLKKENIIKLILLTAVFALLFINVFQPFNSRSWLPEMSEFKYFLLSSLLVFVGMAVVAVSRIILYRVYGKPRKPLLLLAYVMWVACEVLAMAITFAVIEKLCFADQRDFFNLLKISLGNTACVLLLPYSILWLYFSWDDKNERLKRIQEAGHGLFGGQDFMPSMVKFCDNHGEVRFSVKVTDLIYIKGADNYIIINYIDGQRLLTKTVRGSIKGAVDELKRYGIVRCHRSYMINTHRIKLLEKKSDGFHVTLDTFQPVSIPISRTYLQDVFDLFSNK